MLPTWSRKYRHFSGVTFGSVSSEEKPKAKKNRDKNSTEDVRIQAITTPRIYPVALQNTLKVEKLEEINVPQGYSHFRSSIAGTTIVQATGNLSKNSSTEVIDVNTLAQRSMSVAKHVCSKNIYVFARFPLRFVGDVCFYQH